MKRCTSALRCSAVPVSVCAEAAISCVEALVCCVEAETCSAEARGLLGDRGDLGDLALGARRLGGDLLDGGGDLADAGGHVLDGVRRSPRTPRGSARRWRRRPAVRCAPSRDDADDAARSRPGSRRSGAEISARGALGLLGQLADLLGDDREAAALLAGAGGLDRGVERQQVGLLGDAGDRGDDAADPLRLRSVRSLDRGADGGGGLGDLDGSRPWPSRRR